jgi:hypothetical protein
MCGIRVISNSVSVAGPYHCNADPDINPDLTYHFDAGLDADPDFLLMQIRMRILIFLCGPGSGFPKLWGESGTTTLNSVIVYKFVDFLRKIHVPDST